MISHTAASLLLTPGPTPVPAEVHQAMSGDPLSHRGDAFKKLLKTIHERLNRLHQTDGPSLVLTTSGTGAMEACMLAAAKPGEEVVTVQIGRFGARFGDMAALLGLVDRPLIFPWGASADIATLERHLSSKTRAVFIQATETSTGASNDLAAVGALVAQLPDCVLVVDGMSAVGIEPMPMRTWGIDFLIGGKGYMTPPGVTTLGLSAKGQERLEQTPQRSYYFNLLKEIKDQSGGLTAFTPATSLVQGLGKALELMEKEGFEQVFKRHQQMAEYAQNQTRQLAPKGLRLFAKQRCAAGVTAIELPAGIESTPLRKQLREVYGVTLAGGQMDYKERLIRIGHMGAVHLEQLETAFKGLSEVLS